MPPQNNRPLRTADLVVFDLEATALRPDRGGRIREIAVVDYDGIRLDWKSPGDGPTDYELGTLLPSLSSP